MSYRPKPDMSYTVKRPYPLKASLKAKGVRARLKAVQQAPSHVAANVMDVANFLARYISGKQNIVLSASRLGGFSASREVSDKGREYYVIRIPPWGDFNIGVKGFDRYRIYRYGVFHEACHVKYSPATLYSISDPIIHDLVNIIEDRRIEEKGVKEWPGYLPERIYSIAYGYALRPRVDQIPVKSHRLFEAFMQKYLIGKVKGRLPPEEKNLVERAVQIAEKCLKDVENEERQYVVSDRIRETAAQIKELLNLDKELMRATHSRSPWEDTFTPEYFRNQNRTEEDVKEDIEGFIKELKREAKEPKGEKRSPLEITEEDVEKSLEGTAEAKDEYQRIQREEKVDPALVHWSPVATQGPVNEYKDAKFIQAMNTYLQSWREGYIRLVGRTGQTFSVKEYIKHKDEPFVTRLKQSVKGKKILILADFSGSMHSREEDYKKAIVSSLEVLDSIGCRIAFFAFAVDPASGSGFYRVKTFEEPKLTKTHLAKIVGLLAQYPTTPTSTAYKALTHYVMKHKPEVFITITDGEPDNVENTVADVRRLKSFTRMVAFGIARGDTLKDRENMENELKFFGYHKCFAVNHVHEIPPKLVNLMIS